VWNDVILFTVGLVVGAIGTLVGAGGGFLLVPVLLFLYPDEPPQAVTSISLAVVLINAISGTVAYAAQGRIDYQSGIVLAVATIPGAVIGALLTTQIDRALFTVIFSLILIGVAALLFIRPAPQQRPVEIKPAPGMTHRVLVDRGGRRYEYSFSMRRAFLICLGIGFLSSLLGIGGGIIQVPVFILVLGFPTYIATATSQLMLVVMSLAGTITHVFAGDFADTARRTAALAPGVIVGSQFGAWLSRRMQPRLIARILAVLMTLAALRLISAQFI
jgi:uncharacterized membrane protein YfcA